MDQSYKDLLVVHGVLKKHFGKVEGDLYMSTKSGDEILSLATEIIEILRPRNS